MRGHRTNGEQQRPANISGREQPLSAPQVPSESVDKGGERPQTGTARESLPEILITDRPMREVSNDSLIALREENEPPTLFVRYGRLVHVATDERGRERIEITQPAHLRGKMDRAADYTKETKEGLKHTTPPMSVVQDILSLDAADLPFPALESHVEAPFVRGGGLLASPPCYDTKSMFFYSPAETLVLPAIPNAPNQADVQSAVNLLLDVLNDFPFENDASLANALGLLLTPCIRLSISGQVPIALVDAPQAGTGKSLLASLVAEIA